MSAISETMTQLRGAQKPARGAAAYSRFVNRPLGRPLAATAAVLGMTPSQVTALSALSTFSGVAAIALLPASIGSSVLISALLVLGYALDSADGQLARLTGAFSLSGEWLDHMFDAAKAVAIHLAVLVAWSRIPGLDPVLLVVPGLFAVVASVFFFGMIAVDLLRRIHRLQHPEVPVEERRGGTSLAYSMLVIPGDYGLLCVLFLLLWLPALFVPVYTLLAVANALLLLAAATRWHRALRALDRSA